MKKKSLILCSATALLGVSALSGCAGLQSSNTLVVWVGSESVEYYRDLAKTFLNDNPEFGYKISIIGADTGSAGGQMVADNGACGDIVTIAHDNIGKLSQSSYIAPIVGSAAEGKALLDQINADNPEGFKKAIKNMLGTDHPEYTYTFAVPYISQALFLYYDTRYITDAEADTFEGLEQAAARYDKDHGVSGTKSYTVTGTDGFNFSFSLLHRNISGGNTSTLRLYEGGKRSDAYCQSNEQVAVMKWMQRSYASNNGCMLGSDSPWATNIEQHKALSVIGGAWHYESFKKAVTDSNGKVNMGCKIIPQFTLTAQDVEGIQQVNYPNDAGLPAELRGKVDPVPAVGTVFRGGSFVDCKCFVINMAKMTGPEKYYKMCDLLRYFSTKQVQNESFLKCLNVPAYAGAEAYIEEVKDKVDHTAYLMASSQTGMSTYGIPQPFVDGTLNQLYYSMSAPDQYVQCVKKSQDSTSGKIIGGDVQGIREVLFKMEYIWKWGNPPAKTSMPTDFPHQTTDRIQ